MNTTPESTGFGLIAWLENTRVRLPLKGIDCRFDITSGVAAVEIDQIYLQENSRPLDCTYTFPLPAGAAVYRCEVDINGRVIRAIVEEKREARRIFKEQKAAGRRTALVESERENLFTLQLGNVQPRDVIIVRFAYVQALERGGGEQRRLRIPVCPGVRYIPGNPLLRTQRGKGTVNDTDQVPDASRISPPRIDQLHPDAAYCAISGTLPVTDAAQGSLASPTHPTRAHLSGTSWNVLLDDNGAVPDRDFVLLWEPPVEQALVPRAWGSRQDGGTYALVQLRAPRDVLLAEDFEQDFYFLVDRSGSMQGAKWEKTCVALTAFVDLLGERDRVWITLFESHYKDYAESPLPAHEVRDDRAFQSLVSQGTAGGTELVPAARHVLQKVREHSLNRRSVVIVITDGEVGNEMEVLKTFAQAPGTTVFTFGIDTAVNDALLRLLAAQHRGTCVLQTPNDDIAAAVSGLGDRLRRPVITDLQVVAGWEPGTTQLPDLFRGETADLLLRADNARETVEITGKRADGRTETWNLPITKTCSDAPRLLWARERITTHESANEDAQALELAKKYNVLCKAAAFIAWDEAERVEIAKEELYQPSMEQEVLMECGGTPLIEFRDLVAAAPAAERERKFSLGSIGANTRRMGLRKAGKEAVQQQEIRISEDITLPRVVTLVLLAWLRDDTIRGDRKRAFDQLIEHLRHQLEHGPKGPSTRVAMVKQQLLEFALAHMDEPMRKIVEFGLENWLILSGVA